MNPRHDLLLGSALAVLFASSIVLHATAKSREQRPILPNTTRDQLTTHEPSIAFNRLLMFEDGDVHARFQFRNPTNHAVYYYGYDEEFPQLTFQCRLNGVWQDVDWYGCGTGIEPRTMGAGTSFEVSVGLTAWTDIRDNMHMSLLDYKNDLRIGTRIGLRPDAIEEQLWSNEIRYRSLGQLQASRSRSSATPSQ